MNGDMLIDDCSFSFDKPSERSHREGVCTRCVGRIRAAVVDGLCHGPRSKGARTFAAQVPPKGWSPRARLPDQEEESTTKSQVGADEREQRALLPLRDAPRP